MAAELPSATGLSRVLVFPSWSVDSPTRSTGLVCAWICAGSHYCFWKSSESVAKMMLWYFFQDNPWPLADSVSRWQNCNVPSVLPSLSHGAERISRQQVCDASNPSWKFCMELLKLGVVCPWYSHCTTRRKQKQSPFRQNGDLPLLSAGWSWLVKHQLTGDRTVDGLDQVRVI